MTTTNAKTRSAKNRQPKPKKKHHYFRWLFLIGFLCALLAVAGGGLLFWYYAKDAPKLTDTALESKPSTKLFDQNGSLLMELGDGKRSLLSANEIPQQLSDAITSIEDQRFYKHKGIDPIRIVGAALSNLRGNSTQGGSTLTQQLIKLSYFSTKEEDQTIRRKAQEAWLALKLERVKSKQEILAYYINKVYMSNGIYGIETASELYYGKKLKDLSLAQTALLAGMPQAPATYDPTLKDAKHQKATKTRRDLVLSEMYQNKKITKAAYDKAVATPITDGVQALPETSTKEKIADNYLKEVIAEVEEKTKKNPYNSGMNIYTNLDMNAQQYLYNLVNSDQYIYYPSDQFQTAVTVMDVKTGKVKAQIGGRKIKEGVTFGENLATSAQRDLGSTVKPITDYGPAIEYLNYSTGTIISDSSYSYPGTSTPVYDYDKSYLGSITMRKALTDSRNIPAVKTLEKVGLDNSATFLKKLGITYKNGLTYSNAISTSSITPLQLAAAYVPFANGGTYYTPSYVNKVVMADGQTVDFTSTGTKAMEDSTAYMMTDMLKDVINQGTGTTAAIAGVPQAGKTGTSNYSDDAQVIGDASGSPDSSFVGYTTDYAISVWTGNQNYLQALSGSETKIAAQLYRYMMSYYTDQKIPDDWTQPESVVKLYGQLYVRGHTTDQDTYIPSTSSSTQKQESSSSSQTTTSESSTTSSTESSSSSTESSSSSASETSTASSSSTSSEPVSSNSSPTQSTTQEQQ